jgi:hypothetical protein
MEVKYPAIVLILFVVLSITLLGGVKVDTIASNINFTATPTPTAALQKAGCMMPIPMPAVTPSVLPTPTPEPIIGSNVVRERSGLIIIAAMKKYDRDCDGISDFDDNCKDLYNPKQKDKNKNGFGDACEPKRVRKINRSKQE